MNSQFPNAGNRFLRKLISAQIVACGLAAAPLAVTAASNDTASAKENSAATQLDKKQTSGKKTHIPEFKHMDTNDNQALDWSEIETVYPTELAQTNWQKEEVMQRFDNDGDQKLGKQEYNEFVTALANELTDTARGNRTLQNNEAMTMSAQQDSGSAQQDSGAARPSQNQQQASGQQQAEIQQQGDTQQQADSRLSSTSQMDSRTQAQQSQPTGVRAQNSSAERVTRSSNAEPSTMQTTAGTKDMPTDDTNINALDARSGSESQAAQVASEREQNRNAQAGSSSNKQANQQASATEQQRSEATPSSETNQQSIPAVTTMVVAVFPEENIPVSEIKDREVVNSQGENVGDVAEVIVNGDGVVTGMVVSIGGFLNIGDKDVFVDITELQLSGDQVVWQTNMSEDALKSLPAYDAEAYSSL